MYNSAVYANRFREIDISELFYYAAFAFQCIASLLVTTSFTSILFIPIDVVTNALQLISVCLLGIKLILDKPNIINIYLYIILIIAALYTYTTSALSNMIWIILFVISGKEIKVRRVAWVVLTTAITVSIATILFGMFQEIDSLSLARSYNGIRDSLGFKHPNYLGRALFLICLSFATLHRFELKINHILIVITILIFTEITSGSRTAVIGIGLILLACIVNSKIGNDISRYMLPIVVISVTIIILSIYFMIYYNAGSSVHTQLDSLLSYRLSLSNYYYNIHSFSLFGQSFSDAPVKLYEYGATTFVVDNAICRLYLRYGVIVSALFLAAYFTTLVRAISANDRIVAIGLAVMLFIGFTEQYLIDITVNFFLIGMYKYLFSKKIFPEV